MVSAVKLDTGTYEEEAGADFGETRCLAWSHGGERTEVLDGRSGLTVDGLTSRFSRDGLGSVAERWTSSDEVWDGMGEDTYLSGKSLLRMAGCQYWVSDVDSFWKLQPLPTHA